MQVRVRIPFAAIFADTPRADKSWWRSIFCFHSWYRGFNRWEIGLLVWQFGVGMKLLCCSCALVLACRVNRRVV